MIVRKSHGLGNDYLIAEDARQPLTPAQAVLLCDRHEGVGGDGILEPVHSDRADAGLKIWNPDGSLAEKSGNGLRIFAHWLVETGRAPTEHTVEVASGVVRCVVDGTAVTVEMGKATFAGPEIPCNETPLGRRTVQGMDLELTAVGMGNPHCVAFVDAFPDQWRALGAALETSEWFPNRTNVQFARVTGPSAVELRIWERGAGETSASGSSSCAVAAAAVDQGRVASPVTVTMPGGTLRVDVSQALDVVLAGPVAPVGRVELHPAFVERLRRVGSA